MALYRNRDDAGRKLAESLADLRGEGNLIVLGLPRGGVPVAFPVAEKLNAPLDVFVVRKLGAPGQEEVAMGAIASGDVMVLNQGMISMINVTDAQIQQVAEREGKELRRREEVYRQGRPPLELRDKTVILVDDGAATGATMRVALKAIRELEPAKLVAALPVASKEACEAFAEQADRVECLATPEPFSAVGYWYDDFGQTKDQEVRSLLAMTR
ncbi:phosphoribosyltransferase [Desulfohalovibrio reitneri]|uniref:phosphoribosyltransferase n=1 Tax=Desulfohalovibrio reitneri TaxID=1307759 RepID=UPI0004A75354|nr:phosphoribosyltransferase [Desulfohalovibrio reitneri]